jgi:hemin uptake protein HemP
MKPTQPVSPEPSANAASQRRLSSKDLFGQATRIRIEHGDGEYLLQITRQGKLILTR